ncbi:acyltransferase [Fulvimarina sp. 2208YS6-2-32]|uniref:Acyltransferase n=1 Tax=Fulvimarina uroteuthidis TaxID=3098149 RepID=A0ABU5I1G0_9HYPH|nr:acyltransferase [Fulvimarina sp. 2208YS6-2-32]MDY8109217.1 acyltransferase [Fulvimarina sp. 2208YS6-2-32]
MQSTSGQYFASLDSVRALAALLVFIWHFNHFDEGQLDPPLAPFVSLLTEGHTGVAVFMTLSGYLFARIIGDGTIRFGRFLTNRALRLLPLLCVSFAGFYVLALWQAQVTDLATASLVTSAYVSSIVEGLIFPVAPGGAWSITVEAHFYLLIPILIPIIRHRIWTILPLIIVMIALRYGLWERNGSIQYAAYFSIIGRLDQFLFGMWAAYWGSRAFPKRHVGWQLLFVFVLFNLLWWQFDRLGGFYGNGGYPSSSAIWIVLTTIEGLFFAPMIYMVENLNLSKRNRFIRWTAPIGRWSYSIYLLHFFFVFAMATAIDRSVFNLENNGAVLLVGLVCFAATAAISALSYRLIERPFLQFRLSYLSERSALPGEGRHGVSDS